MKTFFKKYIDEIIDKFISILQRDHLVSTPQLNYYIPISELKGIKLIDIYDALILDTVQIIRKLNYLSDLEILENIQEYENCENILKKLSNIHFSFIFQNIFIVAHALCSLRFEIITLPSR
jgi:hypothetical protein